MTKWTKGPWAATTRRGSWDWVVYKPGTQHEICQTFHDGTPENKRGEAHAHLIAAAPDLYEALESLVGLAEMQGGNLHQYAAAIKDAKGVLARARNEESPE